MKGLNFSFSDVSFTMTTPFCLAGQSSGCVIYTRNGKKSSLFIAKSGFIRRRGKNMAQTKTVSDREVGKEIEEN